METLTYNNGNLNMNGNNSNQRPHSNKSRSSNFSQAAVNKSDVGDFQAGYFVMADVPHQPQLKLKNHNNNNNNNYKIERQEKRNHRPPHQRARSISDIDLDNIDIQLEIKKGGEINVSYGRLPTPPHRSPTRNHKRNSRSPSLNPQSTHMDSNNNLTLSPPKARKAPHHERHVDRDREYRESVSHSPPKDKGPSPTPNRWAGPAFSNAPPPSSLPLPDFPPFSPSLSSSPPSPPLSSQSSLASSTTSSTTPFLQHYNHDQFMMYPAPYPHFNAHFSFAEAPAHGYHPSLAQLSTDLRVMLNITPSPVLA